MLPPVRWLGLRRRYVAKDAAGRTENAMGSGRKSQRGA